jgi:PAS domain S-box-containing protein
MLNQPSNTKQAPHSDTDAWVCHIPIAAFVTDDTGFILSYNEEAVQLWGRRPEIGIDRWSCAYKLYTTEGMALSSGNTPAARAIERGDLEPAGKMIVERPDGTRRLVWPRVKLIYSEDGSLSYTVTTLADAEDPAAFAHGETANLRREVNAGNAAILDKQAKLLQSEDRYHKMIAEVTDYAILLLDEYGVIQNWNSGAEKIKGYQESEIVGRHFRIFYTPEDRDSGLPERLIAEAAAKGKAIHEGWRQRKDNTLFWGSVVITALHDESGKVVGFSKVTRDLTARRIAEEKLKRYSEDLEFQNKELQQFAYAAAHDMKEPLRKMRYYTAFLAESAPAKLNEKERDYLQRTTAAAVRMQTLIDDLLAYSRASSAGGDRSDTDLNEVVRQAMETYQDTIETERAQITVGYLPTIPGVAFQLRQLFENLLGNSLNYRDPSRTPIITITAESGCLPPYGEPKIEGPYVKITVSDNGIGFEPDKAGKIFDIFQRLDSRGQRPGTGIGLAICKRVIQNHRGTIVADGRPGEGATFTICLPESAAL